MSLNVLHVVRRFGPVGGMERYVWHLTHALIDLGVDVEVLCQTVEGHADPRITIHQLEPSHQRRRWKAMRDFRAKCDRFWASRPQTPDLIVHSHERCSFHHISTFHGPPMPDLRGLPWYQRISPRVNAWKTWESLEVCGQHVQHVVPVSNILRHELLELYPDQRPRLEHVISPGLSDPKPQTFSAPSALIRCLFVGKEWKRKGLIRAIEILAAITEKGLAVSLDVFGPGQHEIQHLNLPQWVAVNGYSDIIPFHTFDVLIHPAEKEPFGMVVAEALASGCRVLMSDRVGAGDLHHPGSGIVSIGAPLDLWVVTFERLLTVSGDLPFSFQSWRDVAQGYISGVYSREIR